MNWKKGLYVMEQWFVARTHLGREKFALTNLENQMLTGYLPLCISSWEREPKIKCFLPGYLFVMGDLEDKTGQWNKILNTMGIKSVLMSGGGRPEAIPSWIVDDIREREVDGLVQLPPPKMTQREWQRLNSKFKNGDAVTIKGSALDAVFLESVDKHRAAVFVRLLGKLHRKNVLLSRLAPVSSTEGR